ncbi:hypothetical protein [Pseudomonas sp. NCCP-436]|uniref:hypothetical protein n=1 Tax=Pseudomonas sp. NCCP-436 TaxID=2842481 RepID=UPI001C7E383D|nr:hypothetical protein [Pseudomonas sp. NCCP-436]GIZ13199.1 hypothetical protein NCCP436_26150 [Pseudomonas sp. NCCP-436]
MRRYALLRRFFIWTLGLLAGLSPLALAEAVSLQEQIQVHACRATSSLMLLRGEGFQKAHQQRLDNDLAALESTIQSLPQRSEALAETHQALVTQLRNGVSYGPGEDNVPWRFPEDLSRALRDFLSAVRALPNSDSSSELAARIEYLGVQYLSRSYLGTFEIAREQPATYLGQDERLLLPAIDNELAALDAKADPQVDRLQTRWAYLRAALADMNSQSNTLQSVSGRPFAPITVDRHTRALTSQWMKMH